MSVVFFLALLVGIARVYAGIHHPLDVLGSMGIALGSSTLGYYATNWMKQ